ncbi:Calcineurin temperature suppressor Cts1 [Mycena chlorophos]|uniref:Calcineurin temperature suppressor Cts1 n=1 Tax=Mycena chlorophos TaxID=658473 RepID=A0A8H6TD56_MYCCL|nr:Calcineurin temperature suppressor Cts1 [Mycena chlorophos]
MPREIGTLIVVVLKAQHLPNKRHIGKQDPYCLVSVNGQKQRTKVIKKGGQHPEWDDELRFTMYEEDADTTVGPNGSPPPPPPKDGKRKIQGGTTMKLSCFADDPREPDLIGQADVDLTEVLTKGETDEWFNLANKDKFAGKVYLELTFWSNEPAPEKKVIQARPKEYSGPGLFKASEDLQAAGDFSPARNQSMNAVHSRRESDATPPGTLHASNSFSQIDYYQPPYDRPQHSQRSRVASVSTLANDLRDLSVGDLGRRRESFPPPQPQQPSSYATLPPSSSFSAYGQHGYEPSIPESSSVYSYDRPVTPPNQSHYATSPPPAAPYRPPYEDATYNVPPPARGPRYSMPPTSSGFMPLSSSTSSGFVPLASHPSEPSGFAPTLPPTPAPPYANQPPNSYAPPPTQTPAPGYPPSVPVSSSFHSQQGLPASQSYGYPQYQDPPQVPYNTHLPAPPPPPQGYPLPPSPTHPPVSTLTHSNSLSSSTGPGGSRPLPQQPVHSQSLPPPPPSQYPFSSSASQPNVPGSYSPSHPTASTFHESLSQPNVHGSYSPSHAAVSTFHESVSQPNLHGTYSPSHPTASAFHESYSPSHPGASAFHDGYAPPPPGAYVPPEIASSYGNGVSPRRQSSLPTPPNHVQQPTYVATLPPPPPPLPPSLEYVPPPPPLPANQSQQYYPPGPPPRPPNQLDGWSNAGLPPPPPPPPQHTYPAQSWT